MRQITFVQVQAMDLESARAEICNRVYEAAILFERFENAGKVHGNGHHMAQKVAAFAEAMMAERWIAPFERSARSDDTLRGDVGT